jgi:integrase
MPETATFDRITDAKDWGKKTEADMKAGRHFGQSKRHTFKELADEYSPNAKDKVRLDHWRGVFGADTLNSILPARISKERDKLLSEDTARYAEPESGDPELDAKRPRAKRTGATVNRYIAALSACLSYGVKLEWLERNPCERVAKPPENSGRVRYLSEQELPLLLEACRNHADLYLAVVLSLSTGARQGEVMSLRWGQIDLKRKIIALDKTKNGDKRALALVGEAYSVLQARAKVRSLTDDRIFPPTKLAKKAEYLDLRQPWESALAKAEIKDFHWHDLRHTAASYMMMNSVSHLEISKILGHRTLTMALRYAHLADSHLVATGEKLAARLGISA